jgi:S1/P1 Nuclease
MRRLAQPPTALATQLLEQITTAQAETWGTGSPDDWAMEAFTIAKQDAYGDPPLSKSKRQHLDDAYVAQAEKDVALQLSKAGVRLASLLNAALRSQSARPQTRADCLRFAGNRLRSDLADCRSPLVERSN